MEGWIHSRMQDPNHGYSVGARYIENQVAPDAVLQVPLPDLIARVPATGILGDSRHRRIDLPQVSFGPLNAPALLSKVPNR